jgi:hypothetical protein
MKRTACALSNPMSDQPHKRGGATRHWSIGNRTAQTTNYDANTVTFTWVTVHDTTEMTYTNQTGQLPVVPMSSHKNIMTYVNWIQTKFLLLFTNSPTHPWISWGINAFYPTLCPPNQYKEMQLDLTVKEKGKISCYLIFSSWKWHQRTRIVVAIATWS